MMGFNFLPPPPFPQGLGGFLNAAFHKLVLFPILGKGNFQTDPSGHVSSMPGDGNGNTVLAKNETGIVRITEQ